MRLFKNAATHKSSIALISNGTSFSYGELLEVSDQIAQNILGVRNDLDEARITFLVEPSFNYTAVLYGIWKAGGIAVPLCVQHPLASMKYVVEDTRAELVISDKKYEAIAKELADETGISCITVDSLSPVQNQSLPEIDPDRRAMILYTSGTTNKPKGVVTTHRHIEAQITTLVHAWEWSREDRILNVLPLHHVHGIINVMLCALWIGACCEFLPKFNAKEVWLKLSSGKLNLFMGVPTMYYKLISEWENSSVEIREKYSRGISKLRLMVSGSAALPVSVLEKWREITGHTLLERYGMTEIGMGLSNSYRGERRPGHVGLPLEGVQLRLVDTDFRDVREGESGEILIKGPSVFKEYWQKPEATSAAFTKEGWFLTGDVAVYNKGSYKILGRKSVDIIKSGGYKISALEIEDMIRKHPDVQDCAVVGIPDEEWGEIIVAALVVINEEIDLDQLTEWLKEHIPVYKLPRRYEIVADMPRNVLGKVVKPKVKDLFR